MSYLPQGLVLKLEKGDMKKDEYFKKLQEKALARRKEESEKEAKRKKAKEDAARAAALKELEGPPTYFQVPDFIFYIVQPCQWQAAQAFKT
jgi:hypothetical protein